MTARRAPRFFWAVVVLAGVIAVVWPTRPAALAPPHLRGPGPGEDLQVGEVLLTSSDPGGEFARALAPRAFRFPQDHGPHPEFRNEWWYYTGNLDGPRGDHFGYQLTFFRTALGESTGERTSAFAADQIYFAHFALSRPDGVFRFFERFSREAAGLAGANSAPYSVWLENWSVRSRDPKGDEVELRAQSSDISLELVLRSGKPLVAHGDQGLSAKGDESGNASYYVSATRLGTEGRIGFEGESSAVAGTSWFDHEWGTSALPAGAVGWDWFGLQLDDGRELMLYQIRHADGTLEGASSGTWVESDGTSVALSHKDFSVAATGSWVSERSGGEYPSGWSIEVPSLELQLTVRPLLDDQEVRARIPYWEGAVEVTGRRQGELVKGVGFVELTGYAVSLEGLF
jgi:predicted secreted hydrolase